MLTFKHFKRSEFQCRCGCGGNEMADDFIAVLDDIRGLLDFPLIVTSGYRCAAHNLAVSTTGIHGPHTTGRAVDFAISGPRAVALVRRALHASMRGIGINQRGDHAKRFIHLDDLDGPDHPRPNVWSY